LHWLSHRLNSLKHCFFPRNVACRSVARRRSSERQAASGPSHPWTVSLMYVLRAKALLRRGRNCTVCSYCRAVLCKDIFSKAQVVDERLSTTNFGSCQRTLHAKIWCLHPTYVDFSGLLFRQFCKLISLFVQQNSLGLLLLGN